MSDRIDPEDIEGHYPQMLQEKNKISLKGKEFQFFANDDPIFARFPHVPVLTYNGHEFTNYYYSNSNFCFGN